MAWAEYIIGATGLGVLCWLLWRAWSRGKGAWEPGIFGNYAQIASAVIGAVGFALVILQLHENRERAANEFNRAELGDARRLYVTYSASSLQYPELAEPDYDLLMRDHWKYVRYKTFVAHMLWAYDDMLNVLKAFDNKDGLKEWLASFEGDVQEHLRYICHDVDGKYLAQYRPELRTRLERITKERCEDQEPLQELPARAPHTDPG